MKKCTKTDCKNYHGSILMCKGCSKLIKNSSYPKIEEFINKVFTINEFPHSNKIKERLIFLANYLLDDNINISLVSIEAFYQFLQKYKMYRYPDITCDDNGELHVSYKNIDKLIICFRTPAIIDFIYQKTCGLDDTIIDSLVNKIKEPK